MFKTTYVWKDVEGEANMLYHWRGWVFIHKSKVWSVTSISIG